MSGLNRGIIQKYRLLLLNLILCFICLNGCKNGLVNPVRLPDAGRETAKNLWQQSEATQLFEGIDLCDYINGAGELFLQHGFERLKVYRYASPEFQHPIVVERYEMKNRIGAKTIYDTLKSTTGNPVALGEDGCLDQNFIDCYQAHYYLKVYTFNPNNPGTSETLVKFAQDELDKIFKKEK